MARSKARKLADILSGGNALEDGVIAASEVVGLGTAAATAATDYASAAQGALADTSLQPALAGVTSVDATTVAAFEAAGVGGGGSIDELSDGYVSSSDPAVNTNPTLGALWLNSTTGEAYVCRDATVGANKWTNVNGIPAQNVPPTLPFATGGTVVTVGDYKRHTFTTSSTFAVTIAGDFNILVVAAGGAGGPSGTSKMGGGGGAGGRRYEPNVALSTGNYTVAIPGGMAGALTPPNTAVSASMGIYDSVGGGQGGNGQVNNASSIGSDGGSGGGGAYDIHVGGSGTLNQGWRGGSSADDAAGGGGGASEVGANGVVGAAAPGGAGGDGLVSDTSVGFDGAYLAGGGGGGSRAGTQGSGGQGGGGIGGTNGVYAGAGSANTGGGGGGGGPVQRGGNGGSGVVIITYKFQ